MSDAPLGEPLSEPLPHPRVPSARQTLTYLSNLLAAQGLRPRRQFGQNFLIDLNLLNLLVRSANLTKNDVVLEVGSGTGGLTTRLAEQAGHVVSIEIDPGFHRLARQEVAGAANVILLHADVLAGKNTINPAVLDAVRAAMANLGAHEYHVVANFPYDVAAAVMGNLILTEPPVRSMTFTVQHEMAMRILAQPGSKDYGPISVLVQTVGSCELIRTLKPSVFWPRPKVDSAFVRIAIDKERKARIPDLTEFHYFVRMLFIHRRKNLRGSVVSIPEYKPLKVRIPEILESIGLRRDDRAEALPPDVLYRLYHQLEDSLRMGADARHD